MQPDRRGLIPVGLILMVALVLRCQLLFSDPYSDEAWYFYLARSLGQSSLDLKLWPAGQVVDPSLHFLARPLGYLILWPCAQLGLVACRLANIVLGCCLVGLVMRVAQTLGVARPLVWLAGLTCALNPTMVLWSSYVFPDMLGATLVVLALLAFLKQRPGTCALLIALATLVKEVFLVSLIAAFFTSWQPRPTRLTGYLLLAALPYAALFLYVFVYRAMRMQGWAGAPPLDLHFLGWAGYLAAPIVMGLLVTRNWRMAVWALSFPFFYLGRELWSAPGVQPWYAVDGLPLMTLGMVLGLETLRAARWPAGLLALMGGICLASGLSLSGIKAPLKSTADLQQLCAFLRERKPPNLVLVNCDWQAPAYPLGDLVPSITATTWETGRVKSLLRTYDYVLVHVPVGPRVYVPIEPLVELIYRNPSYQLYAVKRRP